ncbi:hypothetical protein KC332_g2461 [Hortaea werneckii]|nr:hypothetical protein KC358_g2412 [Hortaea werneckii]KAI6850645.1 hypothetical protein KC350_g2020 [Hortaea werneckii]KAI6942258.1 hypothetical protein KC341_g2381 [Hortaea werneckii]KAI6947593.1 hypothetical protein KC348_g2438 [Hortaea werneckii]KAI6979716.1 hypothetical protein KC321_g2193 [Hortaea werneckii]
MEGFLRLPASLLALVLAVDIAGAISPQLSLSKYWNTTDNTQGGGLPPPTPTQPMWTTGASLPSTGSGSEYASQCIHALTSFSSKYSAWTSRHQTVENTTTIVGGPSYTRVTYYEDATTLCDGHPRLTTSPGTSLSEGWLTIPGTGPTSTSFIVNTVGSIYPYSTPSCSVEPSDCDPFWEAYSTSLSEWSALGAAQTTPAPQTPPCINQSMASWGSSWAASFDGCGLCTIYGRGVELVYFPPPATVSRDMCASTPLANLTYYEPGAVLEAYAGTQYGAMASPKPDAQTAIVGQNTFTSGTAYISISKVWAENRCSKTKGTPVYDAILAMPSESVLSLRYSQDHFQYAMVTGTQTGFPVSYADFQTPVPWSAWNGQQQCYNSYGGYYCDVIYENKYRPQLAIPPEINMLNEDWKDCQLWYGGLYDPPLALQPAESIAMPTRPGQHQETTSTAEPSSTLAKPTAEPTALADHDPNAQSNNGGSDQHDSSNGHEGAGNSKPGDGGEVWNGEEWVPAGSSDDDDGTSGGSHENGIPGPSRPSSHNDGGDSQHDDHHGGAGGSWSSNDDSSDGGSNNGDSGMGGKGETGSNQDSSASGAGESSSHGGSSGQDGQDGQGSSSSQGNTQDSDGSNHADGAGWGGKSDSGQSTTSGQEDSSSTSDSQQEHNSNHGSGTDETGQNSEEQNSSNDTSGNAQSTDNAANGVTADAVSPQPTTNQVISACEDGVVIDGSTITLATQQPATTVQVNGYPHTIKQLEPGVVEVDGGMVLGAGNDAVTVTAAAAAGATSGSPSAQYSGDATADAIAAGMGMSGPHGGHAGSTTSSGGSTGAAGGSDGSQSTGAGSSSNASGSSGEDAEGSGNSGAAGEGDGSPRQSGAGSSSTTGGSSKDDGSNSGSSADASSISSGEGRTSQQTSSAGDDSASTSDNDNDDASAQQQQTASSSSEGGGRGSASSLSQTVGSGDSTAQQTSTSGPAPAQQTTNAGSRITILHLHGLGVGLMTFMIALL